MTLPLKHRHNVGQVEIPKQERIEDLLAAWDRAAYGVAMRRIEVLIVRGHNQAAREVFEQLLRRQAPLRPTIDSWVNEVLPVRIANVLCRGGYMTLASVRAASDEQLLAIRELGVSALNLIRQTIADVIACRPLPAIEDLSDLWPDWPYCEEYDAEIAAKIKPVSIVPFPTTQPKEADVTSELTQALQTILSADGAAVAEIDRQIEQLNEQIEQLRRVRKFIAPSAPRGKARQSAGSAVRELVDGVPAGGKMAEVVQLVIDAVEAGPVHYRELSDLLEVDIRLLCRAIGRSERLDRDAETGMVSLVESLAAA